MEISLGLDSLVFTEITKYLINIPLRSNHLLTIYTCWHSDIEIKILDNSNDLQAIGIISIEDIKTSAKDLEISYEHFYNECRDALTTDGGLENFIYSIKNNKLIIQKNYLFKITYLEINISETTNNLREFFIAESIEIMNSMRNNFSKLKKKCDKDNSDYKELEKSYKKFIAEKDCLEKTLLSKFIILLNSKKDKIAELQAEIEKAARPTSKFDDDKETDTDEKNTNETDTDEDDDIFNVRTQKISLDSNSNQFTQTQFKCINLPKRKNISPKPSTSKVVALPRRNLKRSCSEDPPNVADLNENSKNNSQDTEIFKNM